MRGKKEIIRQRKKGKPTVSNRWSIDREMKEMDNAFTSLTSLFCSSITCSQPSIFIHTLCFSMFLVLFHLKVFSSFPLSVYGSIQMLADKKLCRPRSSVHVHIETPSFTHVLSFVCIYHVAVCHLHVLGRRKYTHRHMLSSIDVGI